MKIACRTNDEEVRVTLLQELEILDSIEEQAYDDLTALASQVCDTPIALVSLIDNNRQWFKSHHGLNVSETPRDYSFCAHAILQEELFVVEDSRKDKRFHDNPLVTGTLKVIFYAGFPLKLNHHKLGTLCVIDHKPKHLTKGQVKTLTALARQVELLLQLRLANKTLEEKNKLLQKLSTIDPLTQIPNRRALFDALEKEFKRTTREKLPFSIVLIDLDYFKNYNDNYGHSKGDACLKIVAKTLQKVLHRPTDLIARYGGEEFIYILPNTDNLGATYLAEQAAKAIRLLNIEHKFSLCSQQVTISIGIATIVPHYLGTVETLIDQADKALYRAKNSGRNQIHT